MPRPPKVRKPKQQHWQQQSPFLNLPPEVRNIIYRHVLINLSPIDLWPHLFHTNLTGNIERPHFSPFSRSISVFLSPSLPLWPKRQPAPLSFDLLCSPTDRRPTHDPDHPRRPLTWPPPPPSHPTSTSACSECTTTTLRFVTSDYILFSSVLLGLPVYRRTWAVPPPPALLPPFGRPPRSGSPSPPNT